MESIKHKGFLRAYQSYEPPSDVEEKFFSSVRKILPNSSNEQESMKSTLLDDLDTKLKVLNSLSSEFSHHVPNCGYTLHSVSLSQSTLGEGFVSVPEYSGRRSLA